MGPRDGKKPFDASFGNANRYTSGDGAPVQVLVDGVLCPGTVLGRNGPRVQVRFERDGSTYVRWFDAESVVDGDPV